MSKTKTALIRRGFDSKRAKEISAAGHTISGLKQMSKADLVEIGFYEIEVKELFSEGRPPIPAETALAVLWKSRWKCCVCRSEDPVILHHINDWAKSRSHKEENLAVLCLRHHDEAHAKRQLSNSLTPNAIIHAKHAWEAAVLGEDTRALVDATLLSDTDWLYFNHRKLFSILKEAKTPIQNLASFRKCRIYSLVDEDGSPRLLRNERYAYDDGSGITVHTYMNDALNLFIDGGSFLNLSDHLETSVASHLVREGDIFFLQGKHVFSKQPRSAEKGPGQTSFGVRKANGVRVSFSLDLWEATSNSAWAMWLRGTRRCLSLLRAKSVSREDGVLEIACTVLAIGHGFRTLKTRAYGSPQFQSRRYDYHDEHEDDFLDNV